MNLRLGYKVCGALLQCAYITMENTRFKQVNKNIYLFNINELRPYFQTYRVFTYSAGCAKRAVTFSASAQYISEAD
jgi:hypothetical protein